MLKKVHRALLFAAVFSLFMTLAAAASAADIRVLLDNITYADIFVSSGDYLVKGGAQGTDSFACTKGDKISVSVKSGSVVAVSKNGERQFTGGSGVYINADGSGLNLLKYNNIMYRGSAVAFGKGYLVNRLDIEEYLYSVVCKEIGYNQPAEALKAQAVASRSFAAYSINSSNNYYDISKTSQVYGGYSAEQQYDCTAVYNAVKATKGQYVYYNDKPAQTFFSAHAGGYTESNENVWDGAPVDYLRSVPSSYDSVGTANNNWTVTYTKEQLANLAASYMKKKGQSGSFGTFKSMWVSYADAGGNGNTASGRATKVTLIGSGATVSAEKNDIRTLLNLKSTLIAASGTESGGTTVSDEVYVKNGYGNNAKRSWQELYAVDKGGVKQLLGSLSNLYVSTGSQTFTLGGSSNGAITGNVIINGKGYGHGVGMSQYGAIGMAQAGYTYDAILKHYFGGKDPTKFKLVTK